MNAHTSEKLPDFAVFPEPGSAVCRGKVCLVTGATSGIGRAAALALAGAGAHVVALGRSEERCKTLLSDLKAAAAPGSGNFLRCDVLDLSSLANVAAYARGFPDSLPPHLPRRLDVLVNCAGTYTDRRILTSDGYESQFAVNHLAHACLSEMLIPALSSSKDARVVTVSSGSHYFGRIGWKELESLSVRGNVNVSGRKFLAGKGQGLGANLPLPYVGIIAYGQSKLANVLFTIDFARRCRDLGVTVFAADPGLVNTDMGAKQGFSLGSLFWSFRRKGGTSPEVPARAMLALVADPALQGASGYYWKDGRRIDPSFRALEEGSASRLGSISRTLIYKALAKSDSELARVWLRRSEPCEFAECD